MEFVIENMPFFIMKNGKRKTAEGIKPTKSRKSQNTCRKEKLLLLGKVGSRHHQTSGKERKNKKRIPKMKEKTS